MVLRKTLENESVAELRERASKMDVEGRSAMNREELIDAMASDAKAQDTGDQTPSDVDPTDDRPREAQQNTNPDGSRKPTANELSSAVRGFKAQMAADGATEEDINAAFKDAEKYQVPGVYEIAGGNHGHLTPYTTPSSYAIAGNPGTVDSPKDQADLPGGTAKDAVAS